MFVLAILAVGVGILSFSDIAGDKVLEIAASTVKEQAGLSLSVESVKGNPIVGYTLSGVSLDRGDEQKQRIFSARSLVVKVNFLSLLRASPRLSLLAVGGVDMDLDKFVEEISKIELLESSGGGEIPIDRVSLVNSRFTSVWGSIDVKSIGAGINGTLMAVDVSGAVNGVTVNGNFDANVQDQAVVVQKLELQVGKGRLTTAGNVDTGSGQDGAVGLDFQGSLKGFDVSDIAAFWPTLSPQDFVGNADLDFTVEGAGSNLLITAGLDFKGSALGGYPLESLASRLRYANMRLSAENVKATALGIPIEGEFAMAMRTGEVPSIMVKLDGSGVPLSEAAKLYPGLGKVSGKIERFSVDIHGPTDALSGVVELSAPDIVLMGKQIRNAAAQVKLAKGDTATVNGKLVLEGAQAYVQGTARMTGADLDLTANLIDLDVKKIEDLIPDGKKFGLAGTLTANLTIKGKATSPAIGGTLSSPKFTAEGYTLDKPSLSFTYDKDTFTLKESSGSWEGLPIKAGGTVGPLSSKTPDIAMTAQLSFSPETLKRFVPDVEQFKLKGTVNAGVKITGKLPRPNIELVASSQALSAFGTVDAKNLEATTALAGDLSKLDKIDLSFKTASIAAGGVGLQDLTAKIRKDGQEVKLENMSAKSGAGSLTGGGTITLTDGSDARLNLAFDMKQLDLAPLARSGGLGVTLSGLLSGRLEVKGASSNPEISFKGQAPTVAVEGMTLTGLAADVSGNTKALKINDFRGSVGGAPLSATGSLSLTEPFRADFNVTGNGLDLASLTEGVPDLKGQVGGKADLNFSLKAANDGNSGSGSIKSSAVTAFGIKVSDVVIPIAMSGNTLKSEGGTLNLYGGKVTNTFVLNMKDLKFTDEINASGVDGNALAQDATGGLGGRITGRGSLSSFKINGSLGKTVSYSGSGQFAMGEGSITGFTGLSLLSTLYGVDGIRYTQVTAPLRLETGRLNIVKGASVTPPANDPIYRSAKLAEDGTVTFDKKLYFVLDANVNFQLINALAGGVAGGVESMLKGGSAQNIFSGGSLESALKGAVSGGRERGSTADFRDVTAKATGTFDKPSVSLVKVGPGKQESGPAPAAPDKTPATQDIIKEKVIEAIIPQRPEQPARETTVTEEARQEQPKPEPVEKQIEKQIEKKIEDEVRKGLDNLFKKR
jgi:translocation and assembly module TamB